MPVVVTDEHMQDAVGILTMAGEAFAAYKHGQWTNYRNARGESLSPQYVKQQSDSLKFTPEEVQMMATPLARGMAENGLRLPWYAQFALAALPLVGPRFSLAQGLDAALARDAKPKAEESPTLPATGS